ncbi:MAG: MBL fold metallo-hydrolase [Halobacteriales archaeon]
MERIALSNAEFEGDNAVYVLEGPEGPTLVDTGVATDDVRRQLADGLRPLGYALADVEAILLTHWHADHAGLAGDIQRESGCRVLVHEADAPMVTHEDASAYECLRRRRFRAWGMPTEKREELRAFFEAARGIEGRPPSVERVADGDAIAVAGHDVRVRESGGHTDGSATYELVDAQEAFVGDVLLPVYTPNVGGADVRVERPLARYLATLRRIAHADYAVAWPGHRTPIEVPTERAGEIVHHHRERTARVLEVLRRHGPADPWTVSAHLFGELEGIHVMHGPGEAFAHLDHLHHEGVVERSGGRYAPPVEEPDLDELVPAVSD